MAAQLDPMRSDEDTAERAAAAAHDALVVEDSPIARRFLALRLAALGFRVVEAVDADGALAALATQRFDFVFLDVVLRSPNGMDGFALCRRIKLQPRGGQTPPKVVMVTSLAAQTDRVRGQLAGCDAYLTKPLREADFLAAVQSLVAQAAAPR